jgi:hypothetical protein
MRLFGVKKKIYIALGTEENVHPLFGNMNYIKYILAGGRHILSVTFATPSMASLTADFVPSSVLTHGQNTPLREHAVHLLTGEEVVKKIWITNMTLRCQIKDTHIPGAEENVRPISEDMNWVKVSLYIHAYII